MGKKFIFISTICLLTIFQYGWAQPSDRYNDNWKKIDQYEKRGLTNSARKEAKNIFLLAVKDQQPSEQIRALLYLMKYNMTLEEDPLYLNFQYTDSLARVSPNPVNNILRSIQAEICVTYLNQNRYNLYSRTKLETENEEDIRTWGIDKLIAKSGELYKASLENAIVLQQTRLTDWEPMLDKGENTRHLRPTLFDLLAHRALHYFMNEQYGVTQPADRFTIRDENAFAPAPDFVKIRFNTPDSGSMHFQALLLLQKIMGFHLNDMTPDALVDADLIRLDFVNRMGIFNNKATLYEESLRSMEKSLDRNPLAAEAMYLRASLYATKGKNYNPHNNNSPQFELNRARELCESAVHSFPGSDGALHAGQLLNELKRPHLQLSSELVNIPDQPFRSLVSYRNLNRIYLKLISVNHEEMKAIDKKTTSELWQTLAEKKALRNWSVNLPDLQDLQEHSAEIKTDALPPGMYVLMASKQEDFGLKDNIMARQLLYVSRIGYISNNMNDLYVIDRETGMPLTGAEVICWERNYNYQSGIVEEKETGRYLADQNGRVNLKTKKEYSSKLYQIKYRRDELFTDDQQYSGYYVDDAVEPNRTNTFFFTDRSIYRPGQKVYFKGIVIEKDNTMRNNRVISNYRSGIQLLDANGQKIAHINLISNNYGTVSGSFNLPTNTMTGSFTIRDTANQSDISIRVEEYKRPKFSVDIQVPANSYRVNDSIRVTGTARAYAGNMIDGAEVTYRVVRRTSFPFWWTSGYAYKSGPWFPGRQEEMEILNGKTVTGPDGNFSVSFKAIPDETTDKTWQPTFYYEISADITDLNGETRTGNKTIAVSYQAIRLDIESVSELTADSITSIRIRSMNTNGIFNKTLATVQAFPLVSPGRFVKERYWAKPDQYVMGKEEFLQLFPNDPYQGEDKINEWPLGNRAWEITDSTSENGLFRIPRERLQDGWYKIIVQAKDKYGEAVKAERLIRISSGVSMPTDGIMLHIDKPVLQPGETARYLYSTGFNECNIIQSISRPGLPTDTKNNLVKRIKPQTVSLLLTEKDRGGIQLNFVCARYNRILTGSQSINVPWNNKELQVTVETYRDKTLPGADENWSLKISGNQADRLAAEALVSMYDASLDQFLPHQWSSLSSIWPTNSTYLSWNSRVFRETGSQVYENVNLPNIQLKNKKYDNLLMQSYLGRFRDVELKSVVVSAMGATGKAAGIGIDSNKKSRQQGEESAKEERDEEEAPLPGKPSNNPPGDIKIRKNFNETAFFFPELLTDSSGNIRFSFTMPEALTTWKLMAFAHDKNLASGYVEKTTLTQKPLMVQPNAPRFVRQGDRINWPVKVVNLTDKEINGTLQLELLDASTLAPVDGWFKNIFPVQHLSLEAGQSLSLQFPIEIPASFGSTLTWRVKAVSADGQFSDGEEASVPVLSNRMLVTESMPIGLRNKRSGEFRFEKLLNNQSPTLVNQSLTVEYTSNPAWYAVASLPYLMEFPHECAEQQFNRFFANTLASYVSNRHPKIRAVFDQWMNKDSAALLSNLDKNPELKTALLLETPWVLDAQNERKQKAQIALLFDLNRLAAEKKKIWLQLGEMQNPGGGFSWFSNGPDNRYITQYIVAGIGHLMKLGALNEQDKVLINPLLVKAISYLDTRILDDYRQLINSKANLKRNQLTVMAIHYLYMRSLFSGIPLPANAVKAYQFFRKQAGTFWLSADKSAQAMIALSLYRTGETKTPKAILHSLKENAIRHEELGMYWKDLARQGYNWNQSPLENQALMIEAFTEIDNDPLTVDDLKTWLLRQKQTRHWGTTKATAEACYALLLGGSDWLTEQKQVTLTVGNQTISSQDAGAEAGTGYFKRTFTSDEINPGMGQVSVNVETAGKPSTQSSWGAVYWQYFEDLNKITPSASPLKLEKKLFLQQASATGPVLKELKEGDELHIGDKTIVRIILRSDRDMEFLHLKDMRAACMEPINVISGYKWQGGLGYYESTRDAATHFFFDRVPRGTYVFEYPMFVSHTGRFSNGISSIQCMYAPEFSSHSEGVSVDVGE